jgi:putative membrane protein
MMTSDHTTRTNRPASAPRWPWRDKIGIFARGFAMGAADIVPGVSGGSIALITGIYTRFINALGSLRLDFVPMFLRGQVREGSRTFLAMHWGVLIPISLGIMTAVATMSSLLHQMMDNHPGVTFAFFFGLIAASSWVPFKLMDRRNVRHIIVTVLAAVIVFLLVGIRPAAPELTVIDSKPAAQSSSVLYAAKLRDTDEMLALRATAQELGLRTDAQLVVYDQDNRVLGENPPADVLVLQDKKQLDEWNNANPDALHVMQKTASLPWLYMCGMIAISAMLLPGVSGSFLLLVLGQYYTVLGTISRSVHRGLELLGRAPDPLQAISGTTLVSDLTILLVFNLGVLTGVVLFSRVIRWLLNRAHDMTMAVLTGLMLGALRQPGRIAIEQAETPQDWSWLGAAMFVGVLLVFALNRADTATGGMSPVMQNNT